MSISLSQRIGADRKRRR